LLYGILALKDRSKYSEFEVSIKKVARGPENREDPKALTMDL
jgi:hypothetical protein